MMTVRSAVYRIFALSLAFGLSSMWPVTAVRAEAPPPAIIIFDGSGSMWGELAGDKAQKLETARAALRTRLQSMRSDARAGLMSFGHRRKGNCNDIEVMAAPEAGLPERLIEPLDKLDPKGKGPIGLALREAQKLLAAEPKGTVILIHDGPDNCGQDPCAAAAEIAKASPGLAIHTIGLSLERADAPRLACIAAATGGKMFDAQDSQSVTAAIDQVMKLAMLSTGSPAPPKGPDASKPKAAPPTAESTDNKPGLRLSASLAPGGAVISTPLRWRIFKDGVEGPPVLERSAAQISEALPPGKYAIEALMGLALARGTIEVSSDGPTTVQVPLNAGILKLSASSQSTYSPLPEAIFTIWQKTMTKTGETETAALEPIWLGRTETTELVLPAGAYAVRLDTGLAKPERDIEITAGGDTKVGFETAFGRLDLTASVSEGGPLASDVSYIIAEDDPDSPQGRREIARTAHPEPSFSLPSGTYYVTAKTPANEVRQRIALGAGDTVKRNIVIGLTRLEVSALMEQGLMPANVPLVHRVLTLEGEPREIARESGNPAVFMLGNGRYRIETLLGTENVKSATDVELQPGRDAKVTAKLQAARVTLKSAGKSSGAQGAWEIRDTLGAVVWHSTSAETKVALLAPGRYVLRTDARDKRPEKQLEFKTGETRTIDLSEP